MRALLVGLPLRARRICILLAPADAIFDVADDGDHARQLTQWLSYRVLLIGLSLPDMDGCHLIRSLRARSIDSHVIAFITQSHAVDKAAALTSGADDAVIWPAEFEEVRGRLQAFLRRGHVPNGTVIRLGPLAIEVDAMRVTAHGRPICLTAREFAILQLLARHPGRPLAKDSIYRRVYGGSDSPEMKIIDVFVYRIRRKLEVAGAPGLLRAICGAGYALCDRNQADTPDRASRHEPRRWIA
jgi:two-component system cell cycle response regulator CtrA